MVFGRLFDNTILDYVELGVTNFKSYEEFKEEKSSIPLHTRPVLVF